MIGLGVQAALWALISGIAVVVVVAQVETARAALTIRRLNRMETRLGSS
jgi:hypothetical protein